MEKRDIILKDDGVLSIQYAPGFLAKIRAHFDLPEDQEVSDDYIRMFIYGSFKHAIDTHCEEKDEKARFNLQNKGTT
jgi:hypothetical protein